MKPHPFVLATTFVLACVAAAQAQPVSTSVSSVEWEAANSCLVVRAVIDDVSVHALKDGLHPYAGVHRYQTVSVRVLETLKGKHSDRLQFVVDGDFRSIHLSDLQKNKQELLLFLEPWVRSHKFSRSAGGYAYTRFPLAVKNAVLLTPKDIQWVYTSVPVLAADLMRLSTPQQAIDAIKSYLKNRGERATVRGATIQLPPDLRGGYFQVAFTFPVDVDTTAKQPVLDFEKFKERFAQKPPAERKPSYSRQGSGYNGVYALELMATDCDVIVRGVVEEFCFVSRTDHQTGDSYGVKMRMVEAIKGQTPKQFTCFVHDAGDLEKLRRGDEEIVLFLRSNNTRAVSYPVGALEYETRDGVWDDSVIVLNKEAAEVLFADMTWHRDPNEILTRLRAAVKPTAKKVDSEASQPVCTNTDLPVFDVHPPATISAGTSIAGNPYSVIYLPVNQELEDNARKWAAADNSDLRWLATRAMVYFKSEKNAAILKRMLDDEATWNRKDMLHMTGLSHPYEPEFLVRWEAWHVLAGWGFELPRPLFRREE